MRVLAVATLMVVWVQVATDASALLFRRPPQRPIPDNATVYVDGHRVRLEFSWSQDPGFQPGEAVEFAVILNPGDDYLLPATGEDRDPFSNLAYSSNLPVSYRDPFNIYHSLSLAPDFTQGLMDYCAYDLSAALEITAVVYPVIVAVPDRARQFAIGSLRAHLIRPNTRYFLEYEVQQDSSCAAFAWITQDTVYNNALPEWFFGDRECPLLSGIIGDPIIDRDPPRKLLNRLCIPTDTYAFSPGYDGGVDNDTLAQCIDNDCDGWFVVQSRPMHGTRIGDCNDSDPAVHPQATPQCDAMDRDCNGVPDHQQPPCQCRNGDEVDCATDANTCIAARKRCVAGAWTACAGEVRRNCANRECGSDGCTGTCGSCASGLTCSAAGRCIDPCANITCAVCQECRAGQCVAKANGTTCTSDSNPCTTDTCISGQCTHAAVPDGTSCPDDGDSCTDDMCRMGVCSHPAKPNDCGSRRCGRSPSGCTASCGSCPSGKTCNAQGQCDSLCLGVTCSECYGCENGQCQPISNIACASDGNACTSDTCQNGVCTHSLIANDCGQRQCGPSPSTCHSCGTCTPGMTCSAAGTCVDPCAGVPCGDCQRCSNGTCVAAFESEPCLSDGNQCNGPETCQSGVCTSGPSINCPPGRTCLPSLGCVDCTPGNTTPCGSSIGECRQGTRTCTTEGSWGPCLNEITPAIPRCEDKDRDCNGTKDYLQTGCACQDGAQEGCYDFASGSPGVGICRAGSRSCTAGHWGPCEGQVGPEATELCGDTLDNNCDGNIDCLDIACAYQRPCCGASGQSCCRTGASCDAGLQCDQTSRCAPTPTYQRLSLSDTLPILRACSNGSLPQYARIFTSRTGEHLPDGGAVNAATYPRGACFVADGYEDSVVPSTEPAKSAFASAMVSANAGTVVAQSAPFVEVSQSFAQNAGWPEAAYVHCAGSLTRRATTWWSLNYILSPATAEGRSAMFELVAAQAPRGLHPVVYLDSVLPELWYFMGQNTDCDQHYNGEAALGLLDIDFDGVGNPPNDPAWLTGQIEVLDRIYNELGVGVVANVTDGVAACRLAPHLNGFHTEIGTYVADVGPRDGWPRKSAAELRGWERQTRLCRDGQSCYRALTVGARVSLDDQLRGRPFPWDRTDIWQPGGILDQIAEDRDRIRSSNALALVAGTAVLPASANFWSPFPRPTDWTSSSAYGLGWLGSPISGWLQLQSNERGRLDGREYTHGLVLWNDNSSSLTLSLTGWQGSLLNDAGSGASSEGVTVGTILIAPRTAVVLRRPDAGAATLPQLWQDSRILPIPIGPGEESRPLKVTLFYQPDSSVTSVTQASYWATGHPWEDHWESRCTGINEGNGLVRCELDTGCILTNLQANFHVLPTEDGGVGGYACRSQPPGSGMFLPRGSAWIETNHGAKVYLSCVWCGLDRPGYNDREWCTNFGLPEGVLLE